MEYLSSHPINTISKWSFPWLIARAWERLMTSRNIKNGFASCGIYPYSCSPLRNEEMMPSRVFNRPLPVSNATSTSGSSDGSRQECETTPNTEPPSPASPECNGTPGQQMSQIVPSCLLQNSSPLTPMSLLSLCLRGTLT
ncbi:hypothetical protein DPMN_105008 [Dreissena polymorpha]|uniref:Uncharacterized protein n=1 Tax=Dreissena polymorpha TaxID=45954 RepID=A0A9D4K219_DREPO|nr:hypothetical protein DPMN_105008 [Dreissena polymorpha]